jgi:hypothetical protein
VLGAHKNETTDVSKSKVDTPKRESAELGKQAVQNLAPPSPLPSTTSAGEVVYETQTSPVSTRFAGPPTTVSDDDDDNDAGVVYAHLLGSISVQFLARTSHPMFTNVAFSTQRIVCVKKVANIL